jgi:integrase
MVERKRIGLREIRALEPNTDIWDGAGGVAGFGARRRTGAAISYVLMYRTREGRQRRFTIGKHGAPWTPETARDEAQRLLGEVVKGADPAVSKKEARTAATVAELCLMYLADADAGRLLTRRKVPKKATTLATDRSRIYAHVVPLLGRLRVSVVTPRDIERFMHSVTDGATARPRRLDSRGGVGVRGGGGAASRTVGLLGAIFEFAVRRGMRSDNPVRGVARPIDGRRERRLSDEEYKALGNTLLDLSAMVPGASGKPDKAPMWPPAVAAVRFLALTGWRRSEALKLRWSDLDLARRTATLMDTKTGRSVRPLSHVACDVLRGLDRAGDLVFPAARGADRTLSWQSIWARVAKNARLPAEVSAHTLRHSFGSLAGDLGYSELTIGALIGHKSVSITSRYVHAADAVLLAAADAVAAETSARMGVEKQPAEVVPLRRA